MSTEKQIVKNLSLIAARCKVSLEEKDGVYVIESDRLKIKVVIHPKWVGIDLGVDVDGYMLRYWTDTDHYDVDNSKEAWFREDIALDINAILSSFLSGNFLVGTYKNRPSMVFPTNEGAIRSISKDRFLGAIGIGTGSSRPFDSIEEASSDGSYSPLKI